MAIYHIDNVNGNNALDGLAVDPSDYFSKEAKDTVSGVNTDK